MECDYDCFDCDTRNGCHVLEYTCPRCGQSWATHNDDGSCVKD